MSKPNMGFPQNRGKAKSSGKIQKMVTNYGKDWERGMVVQM